MSEWRLYPEGTVPEHTTSLWYEGRERARHLEEPGQRERLLRTAELCADAFSLGARDAVDLGAGDGGLLSQLQYPCWGYDLQETNIEGARERGVKVSYLDGRDLDRFSQWDFGPFSTNSIIGFPSGAVLADRAYEANVRVFNAGRSMAMKALEIGSGR